MVRTRTKLTVVAGQTAGLVDDYLAEERARGLAQRSIDMARATLTNRNNGLLTWCGPTRSASCPAFPPPTRRHLVYDLVRSV